MSRLIFALIGAGFLGLTGCGTFSDAMCGPIDNHVYYRGVRFDIEAVKEGGTNTLMAADIPFSAIADTLLIPYYARTAHQELQPAIANDTAAEQTTNTKRRDEPPPTGRPQN
jgi:uncharacterized protein YceK